MCLLDSDFSDCQFSYNVCSCTVTVCLDNWGHRVQRNRVTAGQAGPWGLEAVGMRSCVALYGVSDVDNSFFRTAWPMKMEALRPFETPRTTPKGKTPLPEHQKNRNLTITSARAFNIAVTVVFVSCDEHRLVLWTTNSLQTSTAWHDAQTLPRLYFRSKFHTVARYRRKSVFALTPTRNVWPSLSWFSRNSQMVNSITCGSPVAKFGRKTRQRRASWFSLSTTYLNRTRSVQQIHVSVSTEQKLRNRIRTHRFGPKFYSRSCVKYVFHCENLHDNFKGWGGRGIFCAALQPNGPRNADSRGINTLMCSSELWLSL